jgi:hypothetical protein
MSWLGKKIESGVTTLVVLLLAALMQVISASITFLQGQSVSDVSTVWSVLLAAGIWFQLREVHRS